MDEDIIYLNNQCDRLNAEKIKLLYSPVYRIGKKLYKIPLIKFLYYILYNLLKRNKHELEYTIDKLFLKQEDLTWHPKVAVYQAVIGNYDDLKSAPVLDSDIYSFFLFTDSNNEYANWKKKEISEHIRNLSNPILINRYLKMHPYELFPDYDFAVYLDGNIQIISDIRPMLRQVSPATGLAIHTHSRRNCVYDESKICIRIKKGNRKKINTQMNKYRKEGFPCHWGLFECTMIICDLKNEIGERILSSWWEEFLSAESLRDQLSLPYILWKNGYKKEDIGNFFINIFKNPKLCWHNHNRSYK
jgi:hypothetical protein